MKATYTRRRRPPAHREAASFKKDNQQEHAFFGEPAHEPFFKASVTMPQAIVQRKCAECEGEEKVQRAPEKKEEEKVQRMAGEKEEEKVQRAPEKEEEKVQRMAGDKEEEKVQRVPEEKEEEKVQRMTGEKEEEKVQKKDNAATAPTAANTTAGYIGSINSKGQALDKQVQSFYSERIGADFSNVKIHTGQEAAESAKGINAQAYTYGNHIVFNEGKYRPETSEGGHLLAHELAHVVQQGKAVNKKLQRRIVINGVPIKVDAGYLKTVKSSFGASAVPIVELMHNNGNPPDHNFAGWDKFSTELRVRTNAIKGMDTVHAGCCKYPSTEPNGYLNPLYWKRNGYMDFTLNPTLPAGKQPSDAVEAIFAPSAGTQLECLTMTVAIEYYSLLKALGKDAFNKKFPGGSGLFISTNFSARGGIVAYKQYKWITASASELLPGDWVYFKNFKDYTTKHPGGFWQGENAIVMGKNLYRGFGVASQTEADLNKELVKVYNNGLPASQQKTVADLLAEGGGLLKNPVIRPDITKISP